MSRQWPGTAAAIRTSDRRDNWYLLLRTHYYGPRVAVTVADSCTAATANTARAIMDVAADGEGEYSWGCRLLGHNEYAKHLALARVDGRRVVDWLPIF